MLIRNNTISELIHEENNSIMRLIGSFSCNADIVNTIKAFIGDLCLIKSKRDVLIVSCNIYGISIRIENDYSDEEVSSFLNSLNNSMDKRDTALELECVYYKEIENCNLSVYSLEKYCEYMKSLTIESLLYKYSELVSGTPHLIFNLILDAGYFYSRKFCFIDSENQCSLQRDDLHEKNIISKKENLCNYIGERKINFLPDDFYLVKKANLVDIQKIFDQLTSAVCLIYISNISKIHKNTLTYKIEGYRMIGETIDIDDIKNISIISESLYSTYKWVFENLNSVSDKLGIARNILSLNLYNSSISEMEISIVSSMRSGYEIYLKENSERYIEVVNQQLIFINEINSNVQGILTNFIHKLTNNFIGFISFIFTTIVFNIVSTGNISNIFTYEITMICLLFMVISCIYLIMNVVEAYFCSSKIQMKYKRNKSFYKLILDEDDLNRILNHDSYYDTDRKDLVKFITIYSILWVIVLFTFSWFLYNVGTFSNIE